MPCAFFIARRSGVVKFRHNSLLQTRESLVFRKEAPLIPIKRIQRNVSLQATRCRYLSSLPSPSTPPTAAPETPSTSILGHGITDIISANEDLYGKKKIVIEGYSESGFDVEGVHFLGSVLCLPHTVLKWHPKNLEDISVNSLSFLKYLNPQIGLLVVGTPEMRPNRDTVAEIQECFKNTGINLEFMDTTNACATFNILNGEDRKVAAALLCVSDDDRP
mmetsp:Transcript_29790/g.68363  ORF Transcript_29790/g.68363 Transcript_29790/m.68363 type:complete len:219 (-) Transcript_29790:447-1103(-)